MPRLKKSKKNPLTRRKFLTTKKEKSRVDVVKEKIREGPFEEEMWGFTRGGLPSWFTDVYHHRSLVFYDSCEGAEKVREYGEKVVKMRVKVEYE